VKTPAKTIVPSVEFREKLFEQSGLSKTRFIAFEVGINAGYCIVLKDNTTSVSPVHPDIAGKVGEYLEILGDQVEGPRWFEWRPCS
jgi:hypothetical protein